MMKKGAALLAGAAFILALNTVIANAYTLDYSYALNGTEFISGHSSTLNDFQLLSFNNVSLGEVDLSSTKSALLWAWTGIATVVNGSVSGHYAAPYGLGAVDTSNFKAVPNPHANGRVNAQLGDPYNCFGFCWGFGDDYNTRSFFKGNRQVASFTGPDALTAGAANGNQTAPSTNLYVNILDLHSFDSFEMKSGQYAFQADKNAAGNTAPVPEPGTIALLGVGMLALVIYGKRRMNDIEMEA